MTNIGTAKIGTAPRGITGPMTGNPQYKPLSQTAQRQTPLIPQQNPQSTPEPNLLQKAQGVISGVKDFVGKIASPQQTIKLTPEQIKKLPSLKVGDILPGFKPELVSGASATLKPGNLSAGVFSKEAVTKEVKAVIDSLPPISSAKVAKGFFGQWSALGKSAGGQNFEGVPTVFTPKNPGETGGKLLYDLISGYYAAKASGINAPIEQGGQELKQVLGASPRFARLLDSIDRFAKVRLGTVLNGLKADGVTVGDIAAVRNGTATAEQVAKVKVIPGETQAEIARMGLRDASPKTTLYNFIRQKIRQIEAALKKAPAETGETKLLTGATKSEPAIEKSVVQIIDRTTNKVEFKTIPVGQLKTFDDLIDNTQTGVGHQIIDGKVYSITAKTPEQMLAKGAISTGTATTDDIPKKAQVQPSKTEAGTFTTQPTQPKGVGEEIEDIIKPFIEEGRKIGIPLESKVYLVGSRASGKAKPTSDYDLVIEGLTKKQRMKSDKVFNFYNKNKIHAPSEKIDKGLPHKYLGTFGELSTQPKGVLEVKPVEIKPKEVFVPKEQLPVGEGKLKASRLEARLKGVFGEATPEQIEKLGLSTFNQMNNKETIAKVADLAVNHQEDAMKMLEGKMSLPRGVPPNAIYVALSNSETLSYELATKLASLSSTAMGQNIEILKELNPHSPVRIASDIYKVQEEMFKKRYGGKSPKEVVKKAVEKAKSKIKKVDRYNWDEFIRSIDTC